MPRSHTKSSESSNSEMKVRINSGSLPHIFETRKHSQLIRKVDLPNIESIHYIKRTPLRITRTRASLPFISSGDYLNNDCQYETASPRKSLLMHQHDAEFNLFSKGFSRRSSAVNDDSMISIPSNDIILTPFAQILINLHVVRDNILEISSLDNSNKIDCDNDETGTCKSNENKVSNTNVINIAKDACESLDWCLQTLENIQTHRAVSDLASIKFQRIINHELQQSDRDSESEVQLCDFICDTFLEKPVIDDESFTDEKDYCSNNMENKTNVSLLKMLSGNGATALEMLDKSIDIWGVDLFEVQQIDKNVLTLTTLSIFKKRRFLTKFNIAEGKLIHFLMKLENAYQNVPYHNSVHAADVTQSSHVILNSADLQDAFTDLEMLAVIFASAIHDVDHPGVTNQFLINTNDPLATLYNDHSVLENHHLATAFKLLTDNKCDILCNLNKQEKSKFRKIVIDMVLATDMACHMNLLADLRTMVESKKVVGLSSLNVDNYNDRIKIMQCIIHCTDLSNPTKPLHIYQKWVSRILEEFRIQGERERQLNVDISPMLSDDKSQIGFIDYIVQPLWETWCDLVQPDDQSIIENLNSNRRFYLMRLGFDNLMKESKDDE